MAGKTKSKPTSKKTRAAAKAQRGKSKPAKKAASRRSPASEAALMRTAKFQELVKAGNLTTQDEKKGLAKLIRGNQLDVNNASDFKRVKTAIEIDPTAKEVLDPKTGKLVQPKPNLRSRKKAWDAIKTGYLTAADWMNQGKKSGEPAEAAPHYDLRRRMFDASRARAYEIGAYTYPTSAKRHFEDVIAQSKRAGDSVKARRVQEEYDAILPIIKVGMQNAANAKRTLRKEADAFYRMTTQIQMAILGAFVEHNKNRYSEKTLYRIRCAGQDSGIPCPVDYERLKAMDKGTDVSRVQIQNALPGQVVKVAAGYTTVGTPYAQGSGFVTADGYRLLWNGSVWTDGDLEFSAGANGLPIDVFGEPLPGTLLAIQNPSVAELQTVQVTRDLPQQGIRAGEQGTIVHVYPNNAALEVEFPGGRVATLQPTDVRVTNNSVQGPQSQVQAQEEAQWVPSREDVFVNWGQNEAYYLGRIIASVDSNSYAPLEALCPKIRAWMESQSYWPNVWMENERGGYSLIDVTKCEFTSDYAPDVVGSRAVNTAAGTNVSGTTGRVQTRVTHPGITELPAEAWKQWSIDHLVEHFVAEGQKQGKPAIMRAILNIERWNKERLPLISRKARLVIERLKEDARWQAIPRTPRDEIYEYYDKRIAPDLGHEDRMRLQRVRVAAGPAPFADPVDSLAHTVGALRELAWFEDYAASAGYPDSGNRPFHAAANVCVGLARIGTPPTPQVLTTAGLPPHVIREVAALQETGDSPMLNAFRAAFPIASQVAGHPIGSDVQQASLVVSGPNPAEALYPSGMPIPADAMMQLVEPMRQALQSAGAEAHIGGHLATVSGPVPVPRGTVLYHNPAPGHATMAQAVREVVRTTRGRLVYDSPDARDLTAEFITANGPVMVDFHEVRNPAEGGATILFTTSGPTFIEAAEAAAQQRGLVLNRFGLFTTSGRPSAGGPFGYLPAALDRVEKTATVEGILDVLDMPTSFVHPSSRY